MNEKEFTTTKKEILDCVRFALENYFISSEMLDMLLKEIEETIEINYDLPREAKVLRF